MNREISELYKNYDGLLQEAELEFMEQKMDLETFYKKVYANKLLAEAMAYKLNTAKTIKSQELHQGMYLLVVFVSKLLDCEKHTVNQSCENFRKPEFGEQSMRVQYYTLVVVFLDLEHVIVFAQVAII